MRFPATLALLATAFVAAGCGERAEPLERELDVYPVAVRGAAQEPVTVDRRPERIVALHPGSAALLAELGAGDRLVGVPPEWTGTTAAGAARVVRPSGRLDVEALAAVDPDLIVALRSLDDPALAIAEGQTGASVYVQPDDSVDAVLRAALELGLLVGEPVRGRVLAQEVAGEVAEVRGRVADLPPLRVYVDTGFLATVPPDSLVADLVRHAGGEPVGERATVLGRKAACRVLDLRPDVVLRIRDAGSSAPPPARLLRRCPDRPDELPRTARVAAALVAWPGPRVGDGARAIARELHPDALP